MNKKQLRDLVADAIRHADEQDAKSSLEWRANRYLREAERLSTFLAILRGGLREEFPEVAGMIEQFQVSAIRGKNPLIDTADSNKEKPE